MPPPEGVSRGAWRPFSLLGLLSLGGSLDGRARASLGRSGAFGLGASECGWFPLGWEWIEGSREQVRARCAHPSTPAVALSCAAGPHMLQRYPPGAAAGPKGTVEGGRRREPPDCSFQARMQASLPEPALGPSRGGHPLAVPCGNTGGAPRHLDGAHLRSVVRPRSGGLHLRRAGP